MVAWGQHLAACVAVAVLGGALAALTGSGWGWLLVAIATVLAVSSAAFGWRTNHRRRAAAAALVIAQQELSNVSRIAWQVVWRGWPGTPVRIRVRFQATSASVTDTFSASLTGAVNKGWGIGFTITKLDKTRNRATLVVKAASDAIDRPGQQMVDRVADVATQVFGKTAKVSSKISEGEVVSFSITHQHGAKLANAETRTKVAAIVSDMLPGQWRAFYDMPTDTVTFRPRPDLPTMVPRPTAPVDAAHELMIPQAIDEDGNLCYWEIGGVMAHQLKAGKTRTGKTVSMIGDVVEAARRGFRVFVVDPKRIEFLGLRQWPNVQLVATSVEDQIAVIRYWHIEMMERYRRIVEEGARKQDFERVLIVIDEYRQFHDIVAEWWGQIKVSGMPSVCPVFANVGSLLRLAAAARIHVVLGTQRPDAEFLGGEVRDNFSSRAALGALSQQGAQMMFDSPHIGTRIPRGLQGRGTWAGDGQPREVQYLYTPDPAEASSTQDLALLAALRPTTTTWPRQQVRYPSDAEIAAHMEGAKKVSPKWLAIELAHLEPYTPPAGQEDPTHVQRAVPNDEPDDTWSTPEMLPVTELSNGDQLEHGGVWGTIESIDTDDNLLQISWASTQTNEEALIEVSDEECLLARLQSL
ncbi:cell division protein FtsK [Mycobacteroides abscessus subsp. abscessus]|nr:cell division protein FtsK [Mycobacteroides abscessus subsp. abscessus]